MRRKRLLKLKRVESEKLRERAINCHRLMRCRRIRLREWGCKATSVGGLFH
jgi:hypothetical protein